MAKPKSPSPNRGEVRQRAMMDAAWDTVMDKGFTACTLDDIISVSGGSKSTLYAHFGGKDGLLNAVMQEKCDAFRDELDLTLETGAPPEDALYAFADLLAEKILDGEAVRFTNLLMTEGHSFPHLVDGFICGGPERTDQRLADYLTAAHKAGQLNVPNPKQAASLLLDMVLGRWTEALKATLLSGRKLGAHKKRTREKARAAVDLFLAATRT